MKLKHSRRAIEAVFFVALATLTLATAGVTAEANRGMSPRASPHG